MVRKWTRFWLVAALLVVVLWGLGSTSSSASSLRSSPRGHTTARGYIVYWDQNEEQDFFNSTTGQVGQLIPPYNPNGQMCILPDRSGRFVTGYNPTLASQNNPGGLKPAMQPPVGEAMWDRNGNFTGQTIYVPGPYMLPGQTVGGDIPPVAGSGVFNDNGTFTGCAFDRKANLFAADLGTAQGQFPSPDNGRVIEWFAPAYTNYCIVDGPTSGGVGPHHVDGTGGLSQPGELTFDAAGNLLVPEVGSTSSPLAGKILSLHHKSLPRSATDCGADGVYPASRLRTSVLIQGSASRLPFPQSVARDHTCHCWAAASTIGDPAIAWFGDRGRFLASKGVVPGEGIAQVGQDPNGYNPFGLTFAPDGSAYFVDIHITCSAPLTNCGPGNNGGRIMRVTFTNGVPNPPTAIATGYNFPTSVTVCVPHRQVCPRPPSGTVRSRR
jgi:hypothetical protein